MMLSEVVRKHLLKERKTPLNDDDLEIAIYVGWNARNEEIERLKAENARYREALERVSCAAEDHSVALSIAEDALKGEQA